MVTSILPNLGNYIHSLTCIRKKHLAQNFLLAARAGNRFGLAVFIFAHMDVSKNRDTPKWMIYNGNPIKMDDLGVPLFLETPIWLVIFITPQEVASQRPMKV